MTKWLIRTIVVLAAFALGSVASRAQTASVIVRGVVRDANTLPEEVEYWEVRTSSNESIVISGRRALPAVSWLRQAKGRTILLTLEASK